MLESLKDPCSLIQKQRKETKRRLNNNLLHIEEQHHMFHHSRIIELTEAYSRLASNNSD